MMNFDRQKMNQMTHEMTSKVGPAISWLRGSQSARTVFWTVGLSGLAYGLFRLYQYRSEKVTSDKIENWAEQLEKKLGGPEKSEHKPSGLILDRAGDRGTNDIATA